MAKRKRTAKRRTSVGFLRTKRVRSSVSSSTSPMKTIAYGFGYGVARSPILGLLSPILQKVNLGVYESNVAMGLISFLAIKKGNGMVKEIGKAGLYVESAAMGTLINPLNQISAMITN